MENRKRCPGFPSGVTRLPPALIGHSNVMSREREPITYPELPEPVRRGFGWRSLKFFGAGAIIASVTIGSGETLFASKGGAIFGYALLWCFLGSALMKGVQVYTGARYMVLSGQHPMTHWARLPGPSGWVPGLIGALSLVCFPFFLAGLPLMIGKTINWMLGWEGSDVQLLFYARNWGTLCIVVAATLTWIQSYGVLERVQTVVVGILLFSVLAAFFASGPDWVQAIAGTFWPGVPDHPEWMIASADPDIQQIVRQSTWAWVGLFLGAIGGGTYDYIGYLGCFRERRWGAIGLAENRGAVASDENQVFDMSPVRIDSSAENVRRARGWLLPVKIDVGIAFLCVLVFTGCFVVLGAEILFPERLVPGGHDLLTHQANFLTQFHPALVYVYQLGIFTAFWGTIYGAYEIYLRTAYECLMPLSVRVRRIPKKIFRRFVILYCAIGGMILLWNTEDPEALIMPAAIVGGVFTCGLWCFAMIWADRKFLPEPVRMGKTLITLNAIAGTVLTGLGLKSLWDYLAAFLT